MGNKRVHYGCLGVALAAPNSFPSSLIPGVQSVTISTQLNNEYFVPSVAVNPAIVYSTTPDVSFTYAEAFDTLSDLPDISGVNDFIDLFMFVGEDNAECMDARKYIRCRYVLLESVSYNLGINGIFTREITYKGFSRYICSTNSNITLPSCPSSITGTNLVGYRPNFNIASSSGLPSIVTDNLLQNITLKYNIAREVIVEPGTRTPYGFMTKFPIETVCSFELLTNDLDSEDQIFSTSSCESLDSDIVNFSIATCGINDINSSIAISGAYLSSMNYTGGDVTGGNQSISVEYTSYESSGLNTFVEFVNAPGTGC